MKVYAINFVPTNMCPSSSISPKSCESIKAISISYSRTLYPSQVKYGLEIAKWIWSNGPIHQYKKKSGSSRH